MRLFAVSILFLLTISSVGQDFYSEFTPENSEYKGITIQNSLPKGGQIVSDKNGNEYVYVIFWSRISNNSDAKVKLQLNFPREEFSVPTSPGVNFQLILPQEPMSKEKNGDFNYGLDIDKVMKRETMSKGLNVILNPGENRALYVIALSNEGVNGTVRAEFKPGKDNLMYNINGFEFNCGSLLKLN